MTEQVEQADMMIKRIKSDLQFGVYTYEEAKEKAEPFIKVINDEAFKVAKKFGRTHYKLTFNILMR
jgi:glutamate formiminotransferase